jgi:signal transduction histidine kinase
MNAAPASPSLRVVATGVDSALELRILAAAQRASVTCAPAKDEAEVRKRIDAGEVDLAIVGDALEGSVAEAMAIAERLAQVDPPVPVLLLLQAGIGAAEAQRLAARGIEALDASATDGDALAQRFMLHAAARARDTRGQRAGALRRVQQALTAGLVHDLRTPLMAINLSAEVASVRSPEEPVQQAMRRVRSSTQRMARALDHLSNVARLDVGPPSGALEAVDLGQLARDAADAVRRDHPGVEIDVVEHGNLQMRAHSAALGKALGHVLSTAAAHAGRDRVAVRIDGSAADRLWFEVTTPWAGGPALAEQVPGAPRERAARDSSGIGLGLQAVEAIVRAHAGSVVGRSKAPEGTVIELLLPRDGTAA